MNYYENIQDKAVKQNISIEHHPSIQGYDHTQEFSLAKLIEAQATTGIQASNLAKAVHIIRNMREAGATIFLSYTSNMVSSGVRESIRWLVENKLVDVLCTTAGAIEEDYIKTFHDFKMGDFSAAGRMLSEGGIQRIGNIFVPIDRYTVFEQHFAPLLDKLGEGVITTKDLLKEMGLHLAGEYPNLSDKTPKNPESSILYWAAKNNIPYFCPAPTDGALGDMIYFAKQRNKEFVLDISADMKAIVDISLNAKKTGIICLGGGVAKHHVLNAMIFRDGADYAVYVNTGDELDASDSGANTQEAISWNKIRVDAEHTKIKCDASLVFPLLVESAFK